MFTRIARRCLKRDFLKKANEEENKNHKGGVMPKFINPKLERDQELWGCKHACLNWRNGECRANATSIDSATGLCRDFQPNQSHDVCGRKYNRMEFDSAMVNYSGRLGTDELYQKYLNGKLLLNDFCFDIMLNGENQ